MKPEALPGNPTDVRDVLPYAALAAGYDVVMEHVDYEGWAAYVHELLWATHPAPQSILELGCGTGTFALIMASLEVYNYLGTDASEAMLRVARAKAELLNTPIQFAQADFTSFRVDPPVDVVVLLYDGLNYLLEKDAIRDLLRCVYDALQPGGLFFFDQSTPANSINNEAYFEDAGEAEGFSYLRRSHYDQETRLHHTTFDLTIEGQPFHEKHVQRAYTLQEVEAMIGETRFEVLGRYDNFSAEAATEASERIHWMLRKSG